MTRTITGQKHSLTARIAQVVATSAALLIVALIAAIIVGALARVAIWIWGF